MAGIVRARREFIDEESPIAGQKKFDAENADDRERVEDVTRNFNRLACYFGRERGGGDRQIENMMYCMGEDTQSGGPYMDDVGGKELLSFIRTCGDADLQTLLYTRAAARGAKCRKYSEHSEAATFEYFATRLQEFAPKSVAVAAVPGPT